MGLVTLITDFGTADGYVGEMKGVLVSAGAEDLVDVTHEVARGDVRAGAWALRRIWSRFPEETVHLVVVDPGVGTDRLPVAVGAGDRWFVGPDNGLLTWVVREHRPSVAVALDARRAGLDVVSDTFHGRDLFAPAAARLAAGHSPESLGRSLSAEELVRLPLSEPVRADGEIRGQVWHVDRFGNLVTNVPVEWLPKEPTVRIAGREIRGLRRGYGEVQSGELLLTRGSVGTLEISARDASAAGRLGAGRGHAVVVQGTDR